TAVPVAPSAASTAARYSVAAAELPDSSFNGLRRHLGWRFSAWRGCRRDCGLGSGLLLSVRIAGGVRLVGSFCFGARLRLTAVACFRVGPGRGWWLGAGCRTGAGVGRWRGFRAVDHRV